MESYYNIMTSAVSRRDPGEEVSDDDGGGGNGSPKALESSTFRSLETLVYYEIFQLS
jgi:hypothetical protein